MAIGLLGLAGIAGAGLGAGAIANRMSQTDYADPSQMQAPTGYGPNPSQILQELVRRHNAGTLNLPKEQVKQLAIAAAQNGLDFQPESKPIRKMVFDLADTAAFGLIPDEFRPTSIGEDMFGESYGDQIAGGLGTAAGALTGGALALRGLSRVGRSLRDYMRPNAGNNYPITNNSPLFNSNIRFTGF